MENGSDDRKREAFRGLIEGRNRKLLCSLAAGETRE